MADRFDSEKPLPCRTVNVLSGGEVKRHFREAAQPVDALETPLPKWNAQCGDEGGHVGLAMGWHVVIAGNTGAGKSLAGLNVSAAALRQGRSVCFVNLEMSKASLRGRLYAILTGEPVRHLEPGKSFDPDAQERVQERLGKLLEESGAGMFMNDPADGPLHDVDDIARFMSYHANAHGCELFVLDYVQRVTTSYDSMIEKVTDVSLMASGFAKRFDVLTLGISQLNRRASRDYDSAPTPQSLMGGSPLENDADQVLLLDHTSYERREVLGPKSLPRHVADTNLILAKNRHGKTGVIPVRWDYTDLTLHQRTSENPDERAA